MIVGSPWRGDPFNPVHAGEREKSIPILKRKWIRAQMGEEEYWKEVDVERRTRRCTHDPVEGFSWVLQASLGRFGEDRPSIKLEGALEQLYIAPEASMPEIGYPLHCMIPKGSTLLTERILARQKHQVTARNNSPDGSGDFSTTYRVVGGSLMALLNTLDQAGFHPPVGRSKGKDGAPWHLSM